VQTLNRTIPYVFAAVTFLAACQSPPPQRATWSGNVSIGSGRAIPFRAELDFTTNPPSGAFLVSDERTGIPEVTLAGDSIILSISEYKAALRGRWDGERLEGFYERYRKDTSRIPFAAWPESSSPQSAAPPGAATPSAGLRLSGNFRVYSTEAGTVDSSLVATFRVRGDSVFGTIIDPSGDYGLMAGIQQGPRVILSRFTGWQVSQIELRARDVEWEASYYVRDLAPMTLTLRPLAVDASILPKQSAARMKDPSKPFAFWGITAQGDTVRHTDPRFSGKVVLLDIMGTWCHNCIDAAPVLQHLYDQYHARGLEIVGLSFEISDDPVLARKNLSLYQQRLGITFPLLFCGSTDPANVQLRIKSQLEEFGGYPSSLFIGRDGRVRAIHTGFNGPGTGDLYQVTIAAYTREVAELIGK
jgi:thiol-disulfide isomerase/thioredoxin